MHVSVTALGASAGKTSRAAGQVVGYLHGGAEAEHGSVEPRRSAPGSSPTPTPSVGVGSYFADSSESPGRWRGEGAMPENFDLGPLVDPQAFRRVLMGEDPRTGETLVPATGSSGRARGHSHGPSSVDHDPNEKLGVTEVAKLVGVDASYIRRVAKDTAAIRAAQHDAARTGAEAPDTPDAFLDAIKEADGTWQITRAEANRFAASRNEPQVVMGYDMTFSVPKSVSALYAVGTDEDRKLIDDAIESGVEAGMDYIEREGFRVRRQGQQEPAGRMVAASYRHYTNRALEPQLHEHVVIANMGTNSFGQTRTLDARGLFAHATTAGYLAGAQLRQQLAEKLGLGWQDVHKGLADVDGVGRDVVMAISSRRQAVLGLAEEMGYFTPAARQKAALATRPGKEHGVEADELQDRWTEVLSDVGFDRKAASDLRRSDELQLWSPTDTEALFTHLGSHRGVTEQHAIFDRRDTIQAVTTFSNDRLCASDIEDLADHWLATDAVVPLEVSDNARRETIGHGPATVSLVPAERRFTTPQMLELEQRVIAKHERGLGLGRGLVDPVAVERAISQSDIELGADQATMVRAITTSGDQFQAVIGRAGAGKTTALRTAVDAWRAEGFNVIGAAPFGEAARKLEAETGLVSQTLEGLLTRIETAPDPSSVLPPNTIVVVDEASTIGNRQLDRLYRHATDARATVRMIGDPQQHQSVEAGGLWKHLTVEFAHETPSLEVNRRQVGEGMSEVREALDEYRHGLVAKALHRLDNDDRFVTSGNWEDLLDTMVADWFLDHQRNTNGDAAPSKMIAERNSDRHALNRRAQALLVESKQIGEGVRIGDSYFHRGDRIVAQARDVELRAPDAERRRHVINGSEGTITGIIGHKKPDLLVDFDDLGTIRVPHEFIATEVGRGRGGGLTPAYALTSYKAEGQTYDSGRNLAAPGAVNTEGMYVALTRGRNDQRTYTIAPADDITEVPELPIIADPRSALDALADSLSKPRGADLASIADPQAPDIAADATRLGLDATGRSRIVAESRAASSAIYAPSHELVAEVGLRPTPGQHRRVWDEAAENVALYAARWGSDARAGELLPITPTASQLQRDAHSKAAEAVSRARVEHLAQVPFSELSDRLETARASIPNSPTFDPERAAGALAHADRRVGEAKAQLADASDQTSNAAGLLGRGRRNMNAVEAARRNEHGAGRELASARVLQREAGTFVDAAKGLGPARVQTQAYRSAFDAALDRRVDLAVRRPADYLTDALGKRPASGSRRTDWQHDARAIESFRHRHLKLEPNDGPLPGAGILRAIGPLPKNRSTAQEWQKVRSTIERPAQAMQPALRRGR